MTRTIAIFTAAFMLLAVPVTLQAAGSGDDDNTS
jgi:hypothetical protein